MERARIAADAARRRYLAVDPANRLVAEALEADWNHKLRELTDTQDDYDRASRDAAATLDDQQQQRIRALATDLPALWHDTATPMRERKRLLRLLITDVTLIRGSEHITAHVRLAGGQQHTLSVPRPLTAAEQHTTPAATVAVIAELMTDHTFDEAVTVLRDRNLTNGWGKPYTVQSLAAICRSRGIPSLRERLRAAGMLTVTELAHNLGVTPATVTRWNRRGLLTARRVDGRREHLYHPGQQRPALHHQAGEARRRRLDGLLSARQLADQLGVTAPTVTRWHALGLITAVTDTAATFPRYPAGQPRPTAAQITAAGHPAAYRDQQLITGGALADRLGVSRSTIYKWSRLGLIDAVTVDYRGWQLYRPAQSAPCSADISAARAADRNRTATSAAQPEPS